MKSLISIREFGEAYGVSRSTVYRLRDRGEIKFVRVGRAVRIPKESIERWLIQLTEGSTNDNE